MMLMLTACFPFQTATDDADNDCFPFRQLWMLMLMMTACFPFHDDDADDDDDDADDDDDDCFP